MSSYWLGVDFETTGLDVVKDSIIEVGAVLWDVQRKVPMVQYGAMIKTTGEVSDEITRITGITKDDLERFGVGFCEAMAEISKLLPHASHIVAHNGTNFDRPILENELRRHGLEIPSMPWIDSSVDIDYPQNISIRKLSYLAAEHGFVNPFEHRAVSDVLTMMKIVSEYDADDIVKWSSSPIVILQAMVSYDDRHLASARGYRWDAAKKIWSKSVKDFKVEDEERAAPFRIQRVKDS